MQSRASHREIVIGVHCPSLNLDSPRSLRARESATQKSFKQLLDTQASKDVELKTVLDSLQKQRMDKLSRLFRALQIGGEARLHSDVFLQLRSARRKAARDLARERLDNCRSHPWFLDLVAHVATPGYSASNDEIAIIAAVKERVQDGLPVRPQDLYRIVSSVPAPAHDHPGVQMLTAFLVRSIPVDTKQFTAFLEKKKLPVPVELSEENHMSSQTPRQRARRPRRSMASHTRLLQLSKRTLRASVSISDDLLRRFSARSPGKSAQGAAAERRRAAVVGPA